MVSIKCFPAVYFAFLAAYKLTVKLETYSILPLSFSIALNNVVVSFKILGNRLFITRSSPNLNYRCVKSDHS